MDKGTKIAVGFGVALTGVSLLLIGIGDMVSYVAGMFGLSSGVQGGLALAGMGADIIIFMAVVVVLVVAIWLYRQVRPREYGDWGY